MTGVVILCISLALQLAAAVLAFRLVRVTGRVWAWLAVAFAILLMAGRRLFTLGHALTVDVGVPPLDAGAELIALFISALMLVGIAGVVPVIREGRAAITERRRTEERYAALVDQASDGIFLSDPSGRYIEANRRGCEMLGYSREELLGLHMNDVLAPRDASGLEARMKVLQEAGTVIVERWLRRKDGTSFPTEISACVLDDGSLQGIVRDISARKAAEDELNRTSETLAALFESAPVAVTVVDPDGNVSVWNTTAESMFGWTAEEVIGKPLPIVPPDAMEQHRQFQELLLSGSGATTGAIVQRVRKDGQRITVRLDTAAVRAPDGSIRGLMAILVDLSEQIALEQQLRQAHKMEAIGQLAGGVAHDFNNLLTAITGYGELIQGSSEPQTTTHRHVGHVLSAAQRASELTQQLLAFGRRQVLQPRVIDLRQVVEGVAPLLHRVIGENIQLVASHDSDVPPVLADPSQIQQVILNLAVNGRDAMPDGGRLEIRVRRASKVEAQTPGDAGWVALCVRDTGAGIPEDVRSQIFEPFFTTKELGKGTGLGLATVYGIVRQSGGSIRVDSQVGRGTTFTVLLPSTSEAVTAEPVREPHPGRVTPGSERVLVVEDEPGVRDLVVEVLRNAGYDVLAARSGEEGAAIAREADGRLDLLLTDVVLPRMNGQQLATLLRQSQPQLRVLYMSGYSDAAVEEQGMLRDGSTFIHKPFRVDELASKVREVLDERPSAETGVV